MAVLENRVDYLENAMAELAKSQLLSDVKFRDFVDEMREFKDEMREFKDEMSDYKTVATAQIDKHSQMIAEIKEDARYSRKVWNELAKKMGTIVEDVVAPNIPRIAKEIFGINEILDFSVRRTIRNIVDKSKSKEFDVLLFYPDGVIVNETKSTVRMKDLHEFIAFLQDEIYEYLPEVRKMKIIPIFASFSIPDNMIKFLSKNGIYAMALSDETMQLLNADEVS
jgi:hypothetical protein